MGHVPRWVAAIGCPVGRMRRRAPVQGPADVAEARKAGENQWTKSKVGLRASTGRPKSMTSGLPTPAASGLANGPSHTAARGWRKCAIGSWRQASASLKISMLRSRFRMAPSSKRFSIAGSRSTPSIRGSSTGFATASRLRAPKTIAGTQRRYPRLSGPIAARSIKSRSPARHHPVARVVAHGRRPQGRSNPACQPSA